MKKIILFALTVISVVSCKKDPAPGEETPFLKFDHPTLQLAPVPGAEAELIVESNTSWKLSLSPAATDWLQLDKTEGVKGKTTIHVKIIKDNPGTQSRSAEIQGMITGGTQVLARTVIEQKTYTIQQAWDKPFGGPLEEEMIAMVTTADNGYAMVGSTTSFNDATRTGMNFWVVRMDKDRNTVWSKVLGGKGIDVPYCITKSSDNGFVIAGYTYSDKTGDVGANHGNMDAWVVKLAADGQIVWDTTIGSISHEAIQSIAATSDGGYLLAGTSYEQDPDGDFLVVKLNAGGGTVWSKTYGGSANDAANAITASPDGGCVVTGYTLSNDGQVSGHHGDYDYWVVKLDASGSIVSGSSWAKTLGGSDYDEPTSVITTPEGNYIIAGYTRSSKTGNVVDENHGGTDYWVVKLDGSNGNILWQTLLGGTGNEQAQAVTNAPGGGYVIAGFSASSASGDVTGTKAGGNDYWLVKLNSGGQKIWQSLFGTTLNEEAYSIATVPEGGYGVLGMSHTITNKNEGYLIKVKEY